MKQCLPVELCIGVLTNLRKILCGLSAARQEWSCRSQDKGGNSANRGRGRCWGRACQAVRGELELWQPRGTPLIWGCSWEHERCCVGMSFQWPLSITWSVVEHIGGWRGQRGLFAFEIQFGPEKLDEAPVSWEVKNWGQRYPPVPECPEGGM